MRSNLGINAAGKMIGTPDALTGEPWRFYASEPDAEDNITITRGRKYQLGDDGGDTWRNYWDGDMMVAFYDEFVRGLRICTEGPLTERAMAVHQAEKDNEPGAVGGLNRLARETEDNPDSRFIVVHLDRSTDLFALSYDGDAESVWREEIEAVWNGDIWRIECQEYSPGMGAEGSEDWTDADEIPEEFYGEEKADTGWRANFPLAEFPADLVISETSA